MDPQRDAVVLVAPFTVVSCRERTLLRGLQLARIDRVGGLPASATLTTWRSAPLAPPRPCWPGSPPNAIPQLSACAVNPCPARSSWYRRRWSLHRQRELAPLADGSGQVVGIVGAEAARHVGDVLDLLVGGLLRLVDGVIHAVLQLADIGRVVGVEPSATWVILRSLPLRRRDLTGELLAPVWPYRHRYGRSVRQRWPPNRHPAPRCCRHCCWHRCRPPRCWHRPHWPAGRPPRPHRPRWLPPSRFTAR